MKKLIIGITFLAVMFLLSGCGSPNPEEEGKVRLVDEGIKVEAIGTYPIKVKVNMRVDFDDGSNFEHEEWTSLAPGESDILSYSSVSHITELVDYTIYICDKKVKVTKVFVVIFFVYLGLMFLLAFLCDDGEAIEGVARLGPFFSAFFTLITYWVVLKIFLNFHIVLII